MAKINFPVLTQLGTFIAIFGLIILIFIYIGICIWTYKETNRLRYDMNSKVIWLLLVIMVPVIVFPVFLIVKPIVNENGQIINNMHIQKTAIKVIGSIVLIIFFIIVTAFSGTNVFGQYLVQNEKQDKQEQVEAISDENNEINKNKLVASNQLAEKEENEKYTAQAVSNSQQNFNEQLIYMEDDLKNNLRKLYKKKDELEVLNKQSLISIHDYFSGKVQIDIDRQNYIIATMDKEIDLVKNTLFSNESDKRIVLHNINERKNRAISDRDEAYKSKQEIEDVERDYNRSINAMKNK